MAVNSWKIKRAAHCVALGGIIAYPTEAVFGLGCDPADEQALRRLIGLKQRSTAKGLILVAASEDQLEDWVYFPSTEVRQRVLATWPGPFTWILPVQPGVSMTLTGGRQTLAVRVSAHGVVQALCERTGALVSTSANVSGQKPARSPFEVRRQFPDGVDFIVPGSVDRQASPTEIRDAVSQQRLR